MSGKIISAADKNACLKASRKIMVYLEIWMKW